MYSLNEHLSQLVLSGYIHYKQLPPIHTRELIVMWVQQKKEMGGTCSTYGGGEACTGIWWGKLRKITTWETQT
jgi:hypothetical protein